MVCSYAYVVCLFDSVVGRQYERMIQNIKCIVSSRLCTFMCVIVCSYACVVCLCSSIYLCICSYVYLWLFVCFCDYVCALLLCV
jgi:hypothetical protein